MTMETLKTAYQYILPQHTLTRLVGKLAKSKNKWIKDTFIRLFLNNFDINLSEAVIEDPAEFSTFNDFFTRALKPSARTIDADPHSVVSPVDGAVSQAGAITEDLLFQAKGHTFSLSDLLGFTDQASEVTEQYLDGQFTTIYLAPKDYHRIHMPVDGELTSMTYVPGQLFSVNPITARTIPNLFARNERVVAHFNTDFGPLAMVLVGATIVGSIETVWSGVVTPPQGKIVEHWEYKPGQHVFKKGDEMGRFLLGSTVILVFGKDKIQWHNRCSPESTLQLGQAIAH